MSTDMSGYVCVYKSKRVEVYAKTTYEAQQAAARQMRVGPRKAHEITVVLAEKDGEQVTHNPAILP